MYAKKIQKDWEPRQGDYIAIMVVSVYTVEIIERVLDDGKIYTMQNHKTPYEKNGTTKYSIIWLPRQDQLQELVRPEIIKYYSDDISYLHREFTRWLQDEQLDFPTYEQLWLAFIMSKLFNKAWNGTNWIKEESK
jgi:hypothetical protein